MQVVAESDRTKNLASNSCSLLKRFCLLVGDYLSSLEGRSLGVGKFNEAEGKNICNLAR